MSATVTTPQVTGTYALDASHSRIGFVARHAMVTKVRGSFNDFEGTGRLDLDDPSNTHMEVTIQADSVDTRNADRDAHVRSEDFFDVETYPTIHFVSTEVEVVDGDVHRVTGDLTIKDVTRPVTIDFTYEGSVIDPWGNTRVGFEGSTKVNRKDWGLTWNTNLDAGGVLVSDKVELEFEISAVRQA